MKELSKEKQIELLEKQLAFWKHHSAELSRELTKEEEIANHYAEMLDKTEEELNTERVKNQEQGYREQIKGEWKEFYDNYNQIDIILCSCCSRTGQKHFNYCPNCGAKMKGGVK